MNSNKIINPVLPGFNPDPSAIRVGDTYYVATSTFEWYPGVCIYESKNLRDWSLVSRPLDNLEKLDMRGEVASDGIWAPNLSFCDGLFYLVYTDMKNGMTPAKDLDNYLITAPSVKGPWSEPIYLNSEGFDPALFHDTDGKKYLINLNCQFRKGQNRFGGILLQEYSQAEKRLVGEQILIDEPRGLREGSNLYKIDGFYYLMIAEGGTGVEHSTVIARSKDIKGPYVDMPGHFLMTTRYNPFHPIQKAGHSSLIDTPNGEWYIMHLGARPLPATGDCILGRETFVQKLIRDSDGWFHLANGTLFPDVEVEPPVPLEAKEEKKEYLYSFDKTISDDFFTLRQPLNKENIRIKNGKLEMRGRRSLFSLFEQSLIARKVTNFYFHADTLIEYTSGHCKKGAGLVALYDQENFYYLERTYLEGIGECLHIFCNNNGVYSEVAESPVKSGKMYLRMRWEANKIRCFYSYDNIHYEAIGPVLDGTILSDEHCRYGRFTGAMIGLCVQDLTGSLHSATFDYFNYIVD